jgi:RND family efflux transporter MFP subunit
MKIPKTKAFAAILVVPLAAALALVFGPAWRTEHATAESQNGATSPASESGGKQIPVVVTEALRRTFESRITVSGSVSAERYAMVSARIPGTLDAIYVDEGDCVEAGKTKLFQTDSVKLSKAVAIAQHDLTVAECSVQEKRAQMEKSLAMQNQSRTDVKRYEELLKTSAIAAQVVDQQRAQCQACDADVKHSQATIDLATAQLEQARLNVKIAEKDMADSLVLAPIDGRVSERFREPGEMAGAGTPVLRIEDLSRLEVSVFLPAEAYAKIVPGSTAARICAGSVDVGSRPVSYKSPTVNPKLRTFEVKALVQSPPDGVVPGCLAEVVIVTDSRPGVGVPSGAVQTRGGRSVVFAVAEGRAKMLPVKIGGQMEGWTEITEGLEPGMPVISMGQMLVDDGTPVSIVTEGGE